MAKMDWDREQQRTKRKLVQAARFDQPLTLHAKFAGQCVECADWWKPGAPIGKTMNGWAHASCRDIANANDDMRQRMAARRQALKENRNR